MKNLNLKAVFLFGTLLLFNNPSIFAQKMAKGNVQDEKGTPLHFVFVEDLQLKNAAFTDSTGNFMVAIGDGSKLKFQYRGYYDTTVTSFANDIKITLRSAGSTASPGQAMSTISTLPSQPFTRTITDGDMASVANGGTTMPTIAHQKGSTHGNRYLFDSFVHGFVLTPAGVLVQNANYLFDYDKIGGVLLLTENNGAVTQVGDGQIKTFTIYSPNDQSFVFEKIPAVDNARYVQVLSSGKKYKIVKHTATKFVKSDYVNNGMTTHGNDYDEFVDEVQYYVVDVQTGQPTKLSLKKKSLKEVFAKDVDKLNKFISEDSGSIDDADLSRLGRYLNND